ncbi:MAG: hypothetical protein JXN65_02990 [Clostridia bacterium]|nr:hypothetical protein [Clostridia bacterium]
MFYGWLFLLVGIFELVGVVIFNIGMQSGRAARLAGLIGVVGAKIVYGVIGVGFIVYGALVVTGTISIG